MSKSYAWRPLALLPILKGSVCTETDDAWLRHRRLELYHRSMDHIIQDINELCSKDIYLCFADNRVRLSRAFYHVLVMDGAEVAAALLCDVNQCPVCTCPHSELDQTDVAYPYRDTESLKRAVSAARSEHLDADGEVKDRHKEEVAHFSISYPISCPISSTTSYLIYSDFVHLIRYFFISGGDIGKAAEAQNQTRKRLFQGA